MIPVSIPAFGVYKATDGYCILYVTAPAGADFPALVDWMREKGMEGDLERATRALEALRTDPTLGQAASVRLQALRVATPAP